MPDTFDTDDAIEQATQHVERAERGFRRALDDPRHEALTGHAEAVVVAASDLHDLSEEGAAVADRDPADQGTDAGAGTEGDPAVEERPRAV